MSATTRQKPSAKTARSAKDSSTASCSATLLAAAIEHVPHGDVKPYRRNARAHNDRQISKLAGVIRQAGFLVPIIVDGDNAIIAGHGRWQAAKALGLISVPVIRADHLSPQQVQAFRL